MKHRKLPGNLLKFLLLLPLLTLTFCDTTEEVYITNEAMLRGDAKVFKLMAEAVRDKSDTSFTKSGTTDATDGDQCTMFKYPISFILNVELAEEIVINSDQELIDFVNSLTALDYVSFYFPITLIDYDGVETYLYSVEELEGTLQMAVDACNSLDDSTGGTDDTTGTGDPNNDGSNDDTTGTTDDTTGTTDDNTGNDSNTGSDDNSGDDSTDNGTDDNSGDDGSDDNSGDDSNHDGSDDNSGDDSNDNGSDDNSGDDNGGDDSNDDSGSGDDDNSGDDSNDDGDHDNSGDDDSDDDYNWCDKNNKKVTVCHNGHEICISVNALYQHITLHRDCYKGPCNN